jgi:hypothetical protein
MGNALDAYMNKVVTEESALELPLDLINNVWCMRTRFSDALDAISASVDRCAGTISLVSKCIDVNVWNNDPIEFKYEYKGEYKYGQDRISKVDDTVRGARQPDARNWWDHPAGG